MQRFLLTALLALAGPAQAAVTVQFTAPDKYIDVPQSDDERAHVLRELQRHFEKLGARLPADTDLAIEVTDVDLAGRMEPSMRYMRDIRILRGAADWPRIELKYKLTRAGQTLAEAKTTVKDMNYAHHMNTYFSDDTLRYEKQMLDDWFKVEILPRTK